VCSLSKSDNNAQGEVRMNRSEVTEKLNQYSKEIYEEIGDKPDEGIGYRNFNPLMSDFLTDRRQPTIVATFFDLAIPVAIDIHEPLSKKLVARRMLGACLDVSGKLEEHINKLQKLLMSKENQNEDQNESTD
jgi:hypothetical protein